MTAPPHLLRLLEAIRVDHAAVHFHPDDPHRAMIEQGAAAVGLAAVPDPNIEYRRMRGGPLPTDAAAGALTRELPLHEPPACVLVRSEWGGVIWHRSDDEWIGLAPNGTTPVATWAQLSAGKFGPIELLIPVPARAGGAASLEQLSMMLDQLANPVIEAVEQLAYGLVSSVRALVADAYRRGERAAVDSYDARSGEAAAIFAQLERGDLYGD